MNPADTSAPPSCNTGAQSTSPIEIPSKNRVVLDWFEFTLPINFELSALNTYFGLRGEDGEPLATWAECPRGMMGYRKQWMVNGIRVLSQGSAEMGHHVILSGDALRSFRGNLQSLIELVAFRGRFTRLDIAIDDVEGKLNLAKIKRELRRGNVTSLFKKGRTIQGFEISSGKTTGETIYLGSPQSRIMVRFYDKAREVEQSTGVRPCDHWIRLELQLRDSHAQQIGALLASGHDVVPAAMGILDHYVQFRIRSEDQNKSRWSLASWWADFIGDCKALKLALPKAKKSLQEKKKWFIEQMAPMFAMIGHAFGADELTRIFQVGQKRLTKVQWSLVEQAKLSLSS